MADIVTKLSPRPVAATVARFTELLAGKGVRVFAVIDQAAAAREAGQDLRETVLVIFGNPKAGTPLMLAAPSSAIDLPLKILIREDAEGAVWVSYNSSAYLLERHGLPQEFLQNIAVVETLAVHAAE